MQQIIHYFLHLVFPVLIAWIFYRRTWVKAYMILLATMLVDADHLLARPIYDPCRCSIGFHPLHSTVAIIIYLLMLFFPRVRIIAIGLLLHMATDAIDCFFSMQHCP